MASEALPQAHGDVAGLVPDVQAKPGPGAGQITYSIILLALAIVGTVALAAWSGVTLADAAATVRAMPLWLVAAYAGLTLVQVALSTWKWQMVLDKTKPGSGKGQFRFFFDCTALAGFLSLFLTGYLSGVIVRGMALKRNFGFAAHYGATTSLFEQAFDVAALLVMVVPTLVVWSLGGSFAHWAIATAISIVLGGAMLRFSGIAVTILSLTQGWHPKAKMFSQALADSAASGLLSFAFLLRLYALSIVRYFVMLVRIPLLIVALAVPIALTDSIEAFTAVQATQIAAITPGQLGIREWTWSGVLALRGYDLQVAARYAIDLRIVGIIALALATIPSIASLCLRGRRQ